MATDRTSKKRRLAPWIVLAALVPAGVCAPEIGAAQPAPAPPGIQAVQPLGPDAFTRLAHSSAAVQARAAELAATRETRPEVKAYAQRMVEFRRGQIQKLEAAARDNKAAVPTTLNEEHRIIFENLEPLDYLALSRRYAEFQLQALEQEIQIYGGAANGAEAWPRSLSAETAPDLRRLLEEGREMRKAVGP